MKRIKKFLFLLVCAVLIVSMNPSVSAATDESSLQTNIALNPSRSGYPSPLESDQGWGGGSDQWEIVDGLRDYPEWYHGLAFTGGNYGVPGVRQATINFGEDRTFNEVIIWHHTYIHIPKDVSLQYWDGSTWKSINFQRDLNLTYQPNAGYADTLTFGSVTGSKVRYSFDNSQNNINGTRIEHGWIYEFEVYEYVNTNQPPVADAGGPYQANEGSPVTFDASLSNDPDGDTLQYRWDLENDGTWDTEWSNDPATAHTWTDDWSGSVKLEVSDGELTSTDTATVTISNANPVVEAGNDQTVNEGDTVSFSGSYTDVGSADTHTIGWDFGDGSTASDTLTPTHAYAKNGTYTVTLTVTDNSGGVGTDTLAVTINNVNPVVEAGNDQTVNEGDTVSFSGSYTDVGSADTHTIGWDFGDGSNASDTLTPTHAYAKNGTYTVTLTVTDDDGGVGTDTLSVTVNNVNPAAGKIVSPIDPLLINTQITTSCTFTDAGTVDTHNGVWDWGDGTSSPGAVSEANGAGTVTGEHVYTNAGVYWVTLIVTDNDIGSASVAAENYVVVYDPEGGFVTGGGWINSPAGAYVPDNTLTGKATFGFVSKYEKGATVPTGNTEFQFKVADLNFKSTSYDWLVVAGSQAKYKGTGTINGAGNYGFMLSAVDGAIKGDGTDKFRIKIWDKESNDKIIYDNEIGIAEDTEPSTSIGGGSIVIHKEK